MARAPTTADIFNAVAEPKRREILALLRRGECSVNQIAEALQVQQPQASKHLRVLKLVGLVDMRGEGQRRVYSLNGHNLKPIYDWVVTFEGFWRESYDRLDEYLTELQQKERVRGRKKQ